MKDYKKILEGVVNIINTTEKSDIGFANICTYIGENCPELQESEDERIRQVLIEYFNNANKSDENPLYEYGIYTDKVINWLEKQGQVKESAIFEHEKRTCKENANSLTCEKQKPTLRERYENIGKSEWFKKTHIGISIGKQPLEEDVVGMGELGKVWNEKQDPILQRLDRIYDLLLHKLNEKIIINNPFPRLTETPYKLGEIWCDSASASTEKENEP